MNKIKILTTLIIILISNTAYSGKSIRLPLAGHLECWIDITGTSFTGSAKNDLDNVKKAFNNEYQAVILERDMLNSEANITAQQENASKIIDIIMSSKEASQLKKLEIDKVFQEKEMDFIRHLAEEGLNDELYGYFSEENKSAEEADTGSQSYSYFKSLCKRNKMFTKISSSKYVTEKNQEMNNESTIKLNEQLSPSRGGIQSAKYSVDTHFSKYCTVGDITNNICESEELKLCDENSPEKGVCRVNPTPEQSPEFKLSNGSINSINFLNPENEDGKSSVISDIINSTNNNVELVAAAEDLAFKTNSTYSEEEEEAARDFAHNVIFSTSMPSPSKADERNPGRAKFVARNRSDLATLMLADNTFQSSISRRSAITDGENPMSELDLLRYMQFNMKDPDARAAFSVGKGNAKDTELFTIMTIGNKLALNKYQQNERLEVLMAALLARFVNSPDNVIHLENLKLQTR
jgi:hypothetical protein